MHKPMQVLPKSVVWCSLSCSASADVQRKDGGLAAWGRVTHVCLWGSCAGAGFQSRHALTQLGCTPCRHISCASSAAKCQVSPSMQPVTVQSTGMYLWSICLQLHLYWLECAAVLRQNTGVEAAEGQAALLVHQAGNEEEGSITRHCNGFRLSPCQGAQVQAKRRLRAAMGQAY